MTSPLLQNLEWAFRTQFSPDFVVLREFYCFVCGTIRSNVHGRTDQQITTKVEYLTEDVPEPYHLTLPYKEGMLAPSAEASGSSAHPRINL